MHAPAPRPKRLGRIVIVAACVFSVLLIAYAIYVATLFGQLKRAFIHQEQFIPTRIYSDVTRIAPSQLRGIIEERLESLGYLPKNPTQRTKRSTDLSFTLHAPDYPSYLIPDNHPCLKGAGQTVTLRFDDASKGALLQSIELGGHEIPDLYLEPEIVATLNQGGTEGKKQIRAYVKYDDIPALIWKAIISVEDQHFNEHGGLDPRGLARALWVDLRTRSFAQGGSTITLQLVKNLMERKRKNPFKKVTEFCLAPLLEASFSKEQILERYLNEVVLGQVGNLEVHGVAEGAELFFGKKLDELNLAEIALMAGQIRGTGYYSPYRHRDRAFERQRLVLQKMVETGEIAQPEAAAAIKMPVRLAPPQTYSNKAPYFADFVKAELIRQLAGRVQEKDIPEEGFRVYTTLDLAVNEAAQQAVSRGIDTLEKRLRLKAPERLEGALAAVDPATGYIRALIGGRSYAQSNFNRILNMKRQVGSTFKPVVYLTALLKGTDSAGVPYSPGHPAEDAHWRLSYDHGRQEWAPKNYEREFLGWTDYRTALANSINTVAAKLGVEVGLDNVIKTARALGIESELLPVPSISLGIPELSPVELLRAYSVLANHGLQQEFTVIRAIHHEDGSFYARFAPDPKQVLDPAPVDLLTDMLQSVLTEGTAKTALALGFDRPAAGKTGTTSNHRDSWFAGYTPQLTTVVWVGMDENQPTKVVLTGATSALPIWVNFMKSALAGEPPQAFPLSPYLVDVAIDRHTGKRAEPGCPLAQVVTEKFIKDHEPADSSCAPEWPPSVREGAL